MADIIQVRDVYGDLHRICRADLNGTRTQISLYTKNGRKLCDYYASMNWNGRATTIHRENVVKDSAQ